MCSTLVTLDMRSPLESPQQRLPVWLIGCGILYQLVWVSHGDNSCPCYLFPIHCTYFIAVDCGDLTDPSNGAVDTSSGTTFMMTATYTCNTGYTFIGDMTRTCQANAMWSLTAPTCTGMPRVVVKCIEDTLCFHSSVSS